MKRTVLAMLPALWLVSCADSQPKQAAATESHRTLNERFYSHEGEQEGYKRDANGNWIPGENRRSSFESKGESPYFKGKYNTARMKTSTLAKSSWWGSKDYAAKTFAGNTSASRFQKESLLGATSSRENGMASSANGKTEATKSYKTSSARENSAKEYAHSSDPNVDSRNKAYQPPEVIYWREQRAMSLDQVKHILGN